MWGGKEKPLVVSWLCNSLYKAINNSCCKLGEGKGGREREWERGEEEVDKPMLMQISEFRETDYCYVCFIITIIITIIIIIIITITITIIIIIIIIIIIL